MWRGLHFLPLSIIEKNQQVPHTHTPPPPEKPTTNQQLTRLHFFNDTVLTIFELLNTPGASDTTLCLHLHFVRSFHVCTFGDPTYDPLVFFNSFQAVVS